MIDSKDAIGRASAYFAEVFPQAKQLQLEEIKVEIWNQTRELS